MSPPIATPRSRALAALRERGAADCSILLGEVALRQQIGGPEILLDQLRHLFGLPPRLAVRVIPSGGDFHPGLNGSFSVFEYSDLPAIVFLDQHRGSAYIRAVTPDPGGLE